jgi:hypothetical protein
MEQFIEARALRDESETVRKLRKYSRDFLGVLVSLKLSE